MLRLCEGIVRRAFERAVDRVDHDANRAAAAERDLAALLGDGDEGGALGGQLIELGEDRVLAFAVDYQGVVAALADPLVDGALGAAGGRGEDRSLRLDDAAADSQPVCGENVHRPDSRRGTGGASVRGCTRANSAAMETSAGERVAGHGDGPLLVVGTAGHRQDRAARPPARQPGRERGPRAGADDRLDPGDGAAPARTRRGAPARALRGALDRQLGLDRRAPPARAQRGGRPRPLLRRARPGRAAGDAARPARRSCRCAATRSAATRPGCWPGCWPGSTR